MTPKMYPDKFSIIMAEQMVKQKNQKKRRFNLYWCKLSGFLIYYE